MLALGKAFEKEDDYEYLAYYIPFVEATVESAPQLTFQICLLITDTHMDTTSTSKWLYEIRIIKKLKTFCP